MIVTLGLGSSPATQAIWPHDFRLRFDVRIGAALEMSLTVNNTSAAVFEFEDALHTYFEVRDVKQVTVTGLEGTTYIDKTDGMQQKPQGNDAVTIVAETDRVYLATKSTCVIQRSDNESADQRGKKRGPTRQSSGTRGSPRRKRWPISATTNGRG